MDKRLYKINALLREYSNGNFEKHLKVSSCMDEIDACISSINMLGEELKEATISRNYFNNIFNSVTDMVFVLDKAGIIKDINLSVLDHLKYNKEEVINKSIDDFCASTENALFKFIIKQLRAEHKLSNQITYLKSSSDVKVSVYLNASWLNYHGYAKNGILLLAKDITEQLQTESALLRAIIDTEEKERQRLARDIHDSLGQQLSAIKFYISACAETARNKSQRLKLEKCNEQMVDVLADMREICFNLIPKTLREFGLIKAVKELCQQVARDNKIDFKILNEESMTDLPTNISIDIFRIIQEFINNAQKHGKASKIIMKFLKNENAITINLKENGIGFIENHISSKSMGLQNVRSRVKSHNGEIKIKSFLGKGTQYFFSFPLNK